MGESHGILEGDIQRKSFPGKHNHGMDRASHLRTKQMQAELSTP
jgi:hypothetical protein